MPACTAVFIGHGDYDFSKDGELLETIFHLIRRGYSRFLCGGMGNFDLACASCVDRLRRYFPHLQLCLVLPSPDWRAVNLEIYDGVICPEWGENRPRRVGIPLRNQYMVDQSSAAVCWVKRMYGGAYASYRMALCAGLRIYHV